MCDHFHNHILCSALHTLALIHYSFSGAMATLVAAAAHGMARTAAQEGCPTSVHYTQPGSGAFTNPSSLCLTLGSSSKANQDQGWGSDVYGSRLIGGGLKTVPRLMPRQAAQQGDAFSPYKLLPLPRCAHMLDIEAYLSCSCNQDCVLCIPSQQPLCCLVNKAHCYNSK